MPEGVIVINAGLSRRYIVRDLAPYTMYSFKIRVSNTRNSSLSGEQRVLTEAAGKGIFIVDVLKQNQTIV